MTGFQFRELHVEGPNKRPATLTFARGLNVISGPSDTGKSYVAALLDFMLGSGKELRDVVEAHGYERAALTIESHDGRLFTLFRSLRGGDIERVEGARTSEVKRTVLSARHSSTDASVSGFLLDLSGLKGQRLKRNSQNETQDLSFRSLAPLVIVTETEMIRAGSPALSGNYVLRTPESSVFKLLLTGEDDSALIASEKSDLVKARLQAQIDLLDGLIDRYANDAGLAHSNVLVLEREIGDLSAEIDESYALINEGRSSLETYQVQRAEAWNSRERCSETCRDRRPS